MNTRPNNSNNLLWPDKLNLYPALMTPDEASQYLRLDEIGHTPKSAKRTLNYWRSKGVLRATKFARRVWYCRVQLDEFLKNKTEG